MARTYYNLLYSRRTTRVVVLQALYEIDCVGHPLDEVLKNVKQSWNFSGPASRFMARLAGGVLENIGELDKIISEFAPTRPVSQMAIVDRNLLRMGIYELAMGEETPPKVAINEAVEIAKGFGSESSPRFVNGVLGAVLQSVAAREALPVSQSVGDPIYALRE